MRKQNKKVIDAFIAKRKATSGARALMFGGYCASISTDGAVLYSYNTPIARWSGDVVVVNEKKYSPTTSRQQSDLALLLKYAGVKTRGENEAV